MTDWKNVQILQPTECRENIELFICNESSNMFMIYYVLFFKKLK